MPKVFKRALTNIRRHSGLTLASVIMMSTTFLVTSLFLVTAFVSNVLIQNLENKAEVTAFFKPDVKEETVLGVKKTLEESGQVLGVTYVSKDDALKVYQDQHRSEPVLLENITANIFPPSLEIKAKDLNDLPGLYEQLKNQPQIDDVIFYKDVVATFQKWTQAVRIGGLSLIAFLGFVSMLIIFLTLGISIHNSASEIEILKLIGAPQSYVRWPFVIQGMIYGGLSAIVAVILLAIAAPLTIPRVVPIFSGVTFPQVRYIYIAAAVAGEVGAGLLVGALGSLIAVRRYLKY